MSMHSYRPGNASRHWSLCFLDSRRAIACLSACFTLDHAFALSIRTASSADPPTSQSFALSEVSVVRLVYSYNAKPASKGTTAGNPVLCTSLGVLVKSFPASTSSTLNTWVLTDGSLLNTATCSLCSGWFEFAWENIDNLYPVVHQCVCQQCIYRKCLCKCFARYLYCCCHQCAFVFCYTLYEWSVPLFFSY